VRRFVEGYGFTWNQFLELKLGKPPQGFELPPEPKKIRIIEHCELRRSYKKIVTKEVKVLRIFRQRAGISQYEASRVCGWSKPTIGHVEQGWNLFGSFPELLGLSCL
jgi:DNA-binding XRE family transcriptional regulator